MRQTWRWFGPADAVALSEVRQAGAEGVVSALHRHPPGAPWPEAEIAERRATIEAAGLTWDVVESLPVSEAIKSKTGDWRAHLDAYRDSLRHLARVGPRVICYNFMPVLDWTRTDLARPMPDGATAMAFDLVDFAVFDIHLLARAGAAGDYTGAMRDEAASRHAAMDEAARRTLTDNIVAGLPGANDSWSLDQVRGLLATYDGIGAERLRANLVDFLSEIVPLAEELGLTLCCHPDDPPFPLLGLPRVMSTLADYRAVLEAVDSPASGVTFCTGSLGVDPAFHPLAFIAATGPRIHFVHLRNTRRAGPAGAGRHSFHESAHLDGDTDMVAVIGALLAEERRRRAAGRPDAEIPMRPDHGHAMADDFTRPVQPGYPLVGRLRGLAELRGVMTALAAG